MLMGHLTARPDSMPVYDLLLTGGTVIDGQRTPRYTSDIAIAGVASRRSVAWPSRTPPGFSMQAT